MAESVYADQWKACADLMRAKAVEFDELAKKAPIRPKEPEHVAAAIATAWSVIDLSSGKHVTATYPAEFVHQMRDALSVLANYVHGTPAQPGRDVDDA